VGPKMRVGSLFAGIGGFDLAARWMGWTTAWFSEIDPYCCKVLEKHWPGVPNLGDITQIDWGTVESVDILCGGFPCQDISEAGKRVGIEGARSGLWKHMVRGIDATRPRWVVGENVAALLRRGWDVVRGDLRGLGYRVARPVVLSASAVGAPQERSRVWIVANANHPRLQGPEWTREPDTPREEWPAPCGEPLRSVGGHWPAGPGAVGDIPRETDGVPNRAHRLKALGNAIVPQCAYEIFSAIAAAEQAVSR
jgi:DNA (cytosine-5)-methyltransferase 1